MDLRNRALATSDWLKEQTIANPLGTVCRSVGTRLPGVVEKGDAILAAAVARGREPRPDLLGKALAAGAGLIGSGAEVLGLVIRRDSNPCDQIADDDSEGDNAEEKDGLLILKIPRPQQVQAKQIFTVHFSRFASLRVAVTCSIDACEALKQRLNSQEAGPIFAKLGVAHVQHQLAQRAKGVSRLAPIAASAVQKVLGDRLTGQAQGIFQRFAVALVGSAINNLEDDSSGPLIEEVVDSDLLDCTLLQGERGPVVHVPLHCDGQAASGYLEPIDFKLIEKNGFLEFADEAPETPSFLGRARSFSDGALSSLPSRLAMASQPFSLPFNCAKPKKKPKERQSSSHEKAVGKPKKDDVAYAAPSLPPGIFVPVSIAHTPTFVDTLGSQMEAQDFCRVTTPPPPGLAAPPHGFFAPPGMNVQDSSHIATPPPGFFVPAITPNQSEQLASKFRPSTASNLSSPMDHLDAGHIMHSGGDDRTAVQLRNLPTTWTRDALLGLLDSTGFLGRYRFVYLPMNFNTAGCLGYADIVFNTVADATECLQNLQGFLLHSPGGSSVVEASWCEQDRQSLDTLIARYRDSPIMHRSVPEAHRPAIFESGFMVKFPAPTKPLRKPRLRHQKDESL